MSSRRPVPRHSSRSLKGARRIFVPLISLLATGTALTILSPHFLTMNNIMTIGLQMAVIAIIAVGEVIIIISAGIDLSVGSVLALSGIVTTDLLVRGVPIWGGVAAGVAAGALCGLANGILVSKGKLPPFIATLAMMGVARGIALIITNGVPIFDLPEKFGWWGGGRLFNFLPVPVLLMSIVALIGYAILTYTRFGRYSYAIGSNIEGARLSGVNVDRYLIGFYSLSGLLSGFAGVVLASRLSTGQPTAGTGYELDVIAACVVGGASMSGGTGTVLGVIIGALIMGVLRNGSNLMNVSTFWQQVLIGVVIATAVYWDQHRQHRARGRGSPRKATENGIPGEA